MDSICFTIYPKLEVESTGFIPFPCINIKLIAIIVTVRSIDIWSHVLVLKTLNNCLINMSN